jgi:hypothetical protein
MKNLEADSVVVRTGIHAKISLTGWSLPRLCSWCDSEPVPNWRVEPSPGTDPKARTSVVVIPTDSLA